MEFDIQELMSIDGKKILVGVGALMILAGASSMAYGIPNNVMSATEAGVISFMIGGGILAIAKKIN